jgi:hypothetical protein
MRPDSLVSRRSFAVVLCGLVATLCISAKRPVPSESRLRPGLRATLFADASFTKQVKGRIDPTIDYDFGRGTPSPELKAGKPYSARWVGWLKVEEDQEREIGFYVEGSVRLWLDDTQVIDFTAQSNDFQVNRTLSLSKGLHHIRVEYINRRRTGEIHLRWGPDKKSGQSGKRQIIPASALFHEP